MFGKRSGEASRFGAAGGGGVTGRRSTGGSAGCGGNTITGNGGGGGKQGRNQARLCMGGDRGSRHLHVARVCYQRPHKALPGYRDAETSGSSGGARSRNIAQNGLHSYGYGYGHGFWRGRRVSNVR